jgi:processive 1,2-diacylglycerol beta-glucosyltransferase
MLKRILLLSASAGAGHVRAAQALEKAFQLHAAERGADYEIRHVDTLDYTNKVFRHLYSKAYIDLVNKLPEVPGWIYDKLDKPWKNERRRLALDKLNTRPFVKLLREYHPDIIVCTHFLPAEIVSWLKAKERLNSRQAIVVTDFDVHAMWLVHHYEHYFVAVEESRVYLEALGILSAGGFGVGSVEVLVDSILPLKHSAQVVAICGRNDELKTRLQKSAKLRTNGNVVVKPIGYTTEMDEFMSASDIVIGKPGGLTTSEALAKGLAFVIVNPIPGQEERNSDHLLEGVVGIRCNNLPTLAYKLGKLLSDPKRFVAMQKNSRAMGRPNAAREIVEKLDLLS